MPAWRMPSRISKRFSVAPGTGLQSPVQRRKRNSKSVVDRYSRTVRSLENPDTLSRPDKVGAIENVQQRDAVRHFADRRHMESPLRGKIDLDHMRQGFQIGKAAAQPAAIDNVGAEVPWFPVIGDPSRGAVQRLMIEHDVVAVDVTELIGIEVELPGRHTFLHISADSGAGMSGEIFTGVGYRRLGAPDIAMLVVERRENRHVAKLSGVQVVLRVFIEGIFRDSYLLCQLMNDTYIPFIVIFGLRSDCPGSGLARRALECLGSAGRDALKTRHLHIPREASVQSGGKPRHINEVDSRIDLIVIGKAAEPIPSHAEVGAQFLGQLPGIFQVDA